MRKTSRNLLLLLLLLLGVSDAQRPHLRSNVDHTCNWRIIRCSTSDDGKSCQVHDAEYCTCCIGKPAKDLGQRTVGSGPCPQPCTADSLYGAWCPWTDWSACGISAPSASRSRDCNCPSPFLTSSQLKDGQGCSGARNQTVVCSRVFNRQTGLLLLAVLAVVGLCVAVVTLCRHRRHRQQRRGTPYWEEEEAMPAMT